jgi:hypothetical protein
MAAVVAIVAAATLATSPLGNFMRNSIVVLFFDGVRRSMSGATERDLSGFKFFAPPSDAIGADYSAHRFNALFLNNFRRCTWFESRFCDATNRQQPAS